MRWRANYIIFSDFFGLYDIFATHNRYDAFASASFEESQSRSGATGHLTFVGNGFEARIAYGLGDSLADIAASINHDRELSGQGIKASIIQEGSGVRLRIVREGARNFLIQDDGDLLAKLTLREDTQAVSERITLDPRLIADPGRLPRGAFYNPRTATRGAAPQNLETIIGELDAAGISLDYRSSQARSGDAYRLNYAAGSEVATLVNLRSGQSQSIDITSLLDAAAQVPGGDLIGNETATIDFFELGVLVTLHDHFDRRIDRLTLGNRADLVTPPTGAINPRAPATFQIDVDGGIDINGLAELTRLDAYNPANGLLTLNFNSPRAGVLNLIGEPGLQLSVDNRPFSQSPAVDLDDGPPPLRSPYAWPNQARLSESSTYRRPGALRDRAV